MRRLFLLLTLYSGVAWAAPGFDAVRGAWRSSEGQLLDRAGVVLHVLRLEHQERRLDWVPLSEISPVLREAVIASEDKQFYSHGGVDWTALGAAAIKSVTASRPRGASTLTMQVAALLEPSRLGRGGQRSLRQKWDQVLAARELESTWSKDQILEAYLNLSSFRGELQGLAAAAQGLFGISAATLDRAQAMLLAVLLRGPNATTDTIARRACLLAKTLVALGQEAVPCSELQRQARRLAPPSSLLAMGPQHAPHVAAKLLREPGARISTTLRADLQLFARDAMRRRLLELEGQGATDAAVLVLDNASGEVLAYIGSSGELSAAPAVDGVVAPRAAGSTLKPFLYGLAFENGWLTGASLLDDAPVNLVTDAGVYLPQNYDRDFRGWVSARTALAGSLNIPAVRTLLMLGPEAFFERLRALGFDTLDRDADHYGYALALGGAEVSLWSLANAYRSLANAGGYSLPRLQSVGGAPPEQVLSSEVSFLVGDILADNAARSVTFGLASPLATRVWSAVKTGTSKDMRDNWCVGFSSRYTVGVWVGNFSGAPMRDVSGVSGAAPLWRDLIDYLHRDETSLPPQPPEGLVRARVRFAGEIESERDEWFLAGTQLDFVAPVEQADAMPHIVYPAQGMVLATDPSIPRVNHRVALLARPARADLRWVLDGEAIGAGARVLWEPRPGVHRLRLEWADHHAQELDFTVKRGAR